jgi:hypothetical protein
VTFDVNDVTQAALAESSAVDSSAVVKWYQLILQRLTRSGHHQRIVCSDDTLTGDVIDDVTKVAEANSSVVNSWGLTQRRRDERTMTDDVTQAAVAKSSAANSSAVNL